MAPRPRRRAAPARIPAWFLVVSIALAFASRPDAQDVSGDASPRTVEFVSRTMGTQARIAIVTADSAAAWPMARAAQSAFSRVDSLMSNWTTTSEVARLNRQPPGVATEVHPEVARVIAAAVEVGQASDGAFDLTVEPLVRAWGFLDGRPRVPDDSTALVAVARVGWKHLGYDAKARRLVLHKEGVRIDLGGIAKGHGVDAAADTLRARGVANALVDLSGNMFALGAPAGAPAWRIGIRDPRDRRPYFARLSLTGEAISTSAKYEQFVARDGRTYGHIMDPRTGRPAEGLIAVTVVAPTAMAADGWSTALFVLGARDAMRIAAGRPELHAVLVAPAAAGPDTVFVERSLADRFALEPGAAADFRVEFFD